jgi:hypothetical protein
MLRIGRGARAEEVEAEAAPALAGIEVAEGILAGDLLALQELGGRLDLLPGLRHAPFALSAAILPLLREIRVAEIVGAVIEVVAVAVAGDAIGLAFPGADRRFQIVDIVVHLDLLGDPVRHDRGEALAADVALEGGAHFDDVEIDGAGRDRLLEAGVVIGLRQIDPGDLGAGIGLPRLQEAAIQEIMLVLVVEAHEGELDALELAFLDAVLGRAEAHLADFLPVGIGRRTRADTRDLQQIGPEIGARILRERAQSGSAGGQGGRPGHALQHLPAARLHGEFIDMAFHRRHPPRKKFCFRVPRIAELPAPV